MLKWQSALIFVGITLAITLLGMPSKAFATNWYVSRQATGTVRDGKTWATAWGDFSYQYNPAYRIDWSQIQAGDKILVDAGQAPPPGYNRTVFYGPLVVQKSGVTIEISNEPGRNGGSVSIQDSSPGAVGIDLATYDVSNVTINGSKWVPSYSTKYTPKWRVGMSYGNGIVIGKNARNIVLRNICVEWCRTGLKLLGGQANCYYMLVSDNQTNISVEPQAVAAGTPAQSVNMYYSWVCNPSTKRTVGISSNFDASTNGFSFRYIYGVLGPGLSKAIETNGSKDKLDSTYSLLINPSVAQLQVNKAPADVRMTYCISFMTPLNQYGQAHSCLSFVDAPTISVFGDIIYGGVVNVSGTRLLGAYNKQFQTSGNTVVVSPIQENPGFASNVSIVPNAASFAQLIDLDFTATNNTPGTMYAIKSVTDLCNRVPK